MPSVDLGRHRIEYSVVRGGGGRYTYFRFRPDKTLEVIIPRGKAIDVEKAIRDKGLWILRARERAAKTKAVLTNDYLMFGGSALKIVYTDGEVRTMTPNFANGEVLVPSGDARGIKELVRRWFLKESSAYVVGKVRELSPLLKVRPNRVDVREIGKWGYCTRSGRISFSWQLAALSERLREYVVVHELAHLLVFDHSKSFKSRVASVIPDFRERERELDSIIPYNRLGPLS